MYKLHNLPLEQNMKSTQQGSMAPAAASGGKRKQPLRKLSARLQWHMKFRLFVFLSSFLC